MTREVHVMSYPSGIPKIRRGPGKQAVHPLRIGIFKPFDAKIIAQRIIFIGIILIFRKIYILSHVIKILNGIKTGHQCRKTVVQWRSGGYARRVRNGCVAWFEYIESIHPAVYRELREHWKPHGIGFGGDKSRLSPFDHSRSQKSGIPVVHKFYGLALISFGKLYVKCAFFFACSCDKH